MAIVSKLPLSALKMCVFFSYGRNLTVQLVRIFPALTYPAIHAQLSHITHTFLPKVIFLTPAVSSPRQPPSFTKTHVLLLLSNLINIIK